MRIFITALLAFACIGASSAQEAPAPPTAAVIEPSPEALASGRDVIHSLVLGSGLVDMVLGPMMQDMLPTLRNTIAQSDVYRNASRAHQDALMAFIDSAPELLRREIESEVVVISERSAPRLAALMTAEELSGIAEFLRSPSSRPLFTRVTQRYLANERAGKDGAAAAPSYSDEEIAIMADFMSTPAGIAFYRHGDAVSAILDEEFELATQRMEPRIRALVFGGMCNALGDDCPRELRNSLNPT